jgi:hypothetical protein
MKLSAAEIEQHFRDNEPEETVLEFVEPELDEVIEEPYDYRQDDWLFDDYYEELNEEYHDRYDDPYPYHEDDFYL